MRIARGCRRHLLEQFLKYSVKQPLALGGAISGILHQAAIALRNGLKALERASKSTHVSSYHHSMGSYGTRSSSLRFIMELRRLARHEMWALPYSDFVVGCAAKSWSCVDRNNHLNISNRLLVWYECSSHRRVMNWDRVLETGISWATKPETIILCTIMIEGRHERTTMHNFETCSRD